MKHRAVNPKAEGRGPKEGRNPKTEPGVIRETPRQELVLPPWAEVSQSEPYVLNERETREAPPEDLSGRTARFGESIIRFAKKIPQTPVNSRLIAQVVGAGTSIGANYCEADDAVSGKEFKLKIGTCRKESKETMFFLRMVATAEETLAPVARILWREAKELNLIFGSIWRK